MTTSLGEGKLKWTNYGGDFEWIYMVHLYVD